MVVSAQLGNELVCWIDRRVHVAADSRLRRSNGAHDFFERNVADDKKIDVARLAQGLFRSGAKNERDENPVPESVQCFAEDVDDANGLHDQTRQFAIDR